MARVTVEDCIEKVPNRFELVMLATQRARKISSGAPLTIDRDNDKNPVVSLREIADETVELHNLKEEIITGYQRFLPHDDEEESIDLMDGEKEWAAKDATAEGEEEQSESEEETAEDTSVDEPDLNDIAGA